MSPEAFVAAADRLIKKRKLARPRHEFFVIQRPEHRVGGPNPILWIDSLMRYQDIDYRISLLTSAAHYGASHQAAMVFQVIVPKQLRGFQFGRHRLQFIYQKLSAFDSVNRSEWVSEVKNDEGFAKFAGIELTLLDCMRSYRNAAGIDGVAQIASDIGGKADPRKLSKIATFYENATIRRLGYLLDLFHHERQAQALTPFADKAKSVIPLDPSIRPNLSTLSAELQRNEKWGIEINGPVEIDF